MYQDTETNKMRSYQRYGEMLLDKTNSVRTCVTYGRTPNGQTELLQWDNKLRQLKSH